MKTNKISYQEFLHRNNNIHHPAFEPEMDFYNAIKRGDINKVKKLCHESLTDKVGLGILSANPLQNLKYHFTISAAMFARECIKAGMPLSEAYSLSDYYIQQADQSKLSKEISDLHLKMCLDYTGRMKKINKQHICSKPVNQSIDYIYENLNTRITVKDLSNNCNLSPEYLSRLFKKETGQTITDYILSKKLETAENMLKNSNYSISDISASLAFPSQSYLTNLFKKKYGLTPKQYRNYY